MARPLRGNRKRLLYSTGTAAAVLGAGVALVASPVLAERPWAAKTTTAPPKPTTAPAPTSTVTQKPTTTTTSDPKPTTAECHTDAPATLTDYVAEHTDKLTRVGCNSDVAVYYNDQLKALPATQTAWVTPFATDVWKYLKKSYGACDAPRTLTAKVGTACEQWGAPKPALFFMHKDTVSGGTVSGRFDARAGFRTTNDIGYGNWKEDDTQLHDIIVHEACHQVEGASQGTHGSPAFPIWGDSKWAEFCLYDFYANTGRTTDAGRVLASFSKGSDDLPAGAKNAAWFKGWFLPLWQEGGKSPEVMEKFFGLTAQYFPTHTENDGADPTYARSMNVGEYVLFTSAAAGKDLSGRAATVFNSGWKQAEFDRARKEFPALKF